MANDINLWQDIEDLEILGHTKEAKDLSKIFNFRYNEFDEVKLKKAKSQFFKKYGYVPNV